MGHCRETFLFLFFFYIFENNLLGREMITDATIVLWLIFLSYHGLRMPLKWVLKIGILTSIDRFSLSS